jgi:hypothetical protein
MMMGMFASGTQKAIVLQRKAKTDADRLSVIHLKHCMTKAVANETSIIVEAATKAGPMRADWPCSASSGGGDGRPTC